MAERLLQFFVSDHFPPAVVKVAAPFDALAQQLVDSCPMSAERTVALRKLLESKESAIRAVLDTADA